MAQFLQETITETKGRFKHQDRQRFSRLQALTKCIAFLAISLILLASCAPAYKGHVSEYATTTSPTVPDYGKLEYWAAHPNKWDPSDSLPKHLGATVGAENVDVFFVYPTTYLDDASVKNASFSTNLATQASTWNANVNDAKLNAMTDYSTILNQASAFNVGRVFSPRYRQAHYNLFFVPDSVSKPYFDLAYEDIKNAFIYYLAHENNHKPFIIASHSQGTIHAARLIKEMIENTSLQNRLVAAYLIGMPIRSDYFATLPPCKDSNATGCFVSWRTFKTGYTEAYVAKETFKAININPLTWQMDETPARRQLNDGTILYKFSKLKKGNVGAQVHGNELWSTKPRFFGNIFFKQKNYHIGDINLFWANIRNNVQHRINMFWKY